MFSDRHGSVPVSAAGRKRKWFIASLSVAVAIGAVWWWIGLPDPQTRPAASVDQPAAREPVADLITALGVVLVRHPGGAEWREVKAGEPLLEGDAVRTEISGRASIRYRSGTDVAIPEETVFTVQQAGTNQIEISAPPGEAFAAPLLAAEGGAGARPWVELQQIVRFGRTLELIGRVEPGSSLAVNGQIVEVTAEGAFKHFTRPFPASVRNARLSLRVTDLMGRSRVWTAHYSFGPHGEE